MSELIDVTAALERQDFESAHALCQQYIDGGDPSNMVTAKLMKGVTLLREGKVSEAAQYLVEQGNIHRSPEFFVNAAVCYGRLGEERREYMALAALLDIKSPGSNISEAPFLRLSELGMELKQWDVVRRALYILVDRYNHSSDPVVLEQLANACKQSNKLDQAVMYFTRLFTLVDESRKGQIHGVLAGVWKDLGEQQHAVEHFRRSHELNLRSPPPCSNLIMCMQYTHGVTLQQFYDQCSEYSVRFLRHLPRYQFDQDRLDPSKADRGLRIGFMSADFIAHSLTNLMMEPFRMLKVLGSHHTYYCYHSREREDNWSEQYKESVDHWRNVHALSDDELAKQINDDQIDILVDLAGHTAGNRLPVFGRRPAPVQAGWISGMMTPSAISTINYFFTDEWMTPPSAAQVCREQLINLPAAYTYFPMAGDETPDIGPLPADRNGYVTFGSFNNPCKISPAVVEAWAAAMRKVRGSHIHIKVYADGQGQLLTREFARRGISGDRIHFISTSLPKTTDVMQYYSDKIDMVLDTFPCAGCLTSAEAMWMGSPVMTMVGDTFLHRQTWTILNQLGMQDELGAHTVDEFAERAAAYVSDRNKLREFRNTIRSKMGAAPIRQPEKIAQGLVNGFREMWLDWTSYRAGLPQLLPAVTAS